MSIRPVLLLAFATACTAPVDDVEGGSAARVVDEGSAEAAGILALLNDAGTTEVVLDVDAGLDSRAARGLIHHRNGPDRFYGTADDDAFDTIAEVDSVYYVGDSAITLLLIHADVGGWIPSETDVIGVFEGVEFTVEESAWTLQLANEATEQDLDDTVALDARAARGIVAARPIDTMDELAAASYVGASAMQRLKAAALDRYGIPRVGEGETCSASVNCDVGFVCMGITLWDEGMCVSDDLAGTFTNGGWGSIPDGMASGMGAGVYVDGLASVPVDIIVNLDVYHADKSQLVVTLTDPNGASQVIWDREANPSSTVVVPGGEISRDDQVNGEWVLNVADVVKGTEGTLGTWSLYIVSRWD